MRIRTQDWLNLQMVNESEANGGLGFLLILVENPANPATSLPTSIAGVDGLQALKLMDNHFGFQK